MDQDYRGHGEITVISDGEECLKRLARDLPQPAIHILDGFHISMKQQPLVQLARTAPEGMDSFQVDIDRVKWRLWNGQPDRALTLIDCIQKTEDRRKAPNIWAIRAGKLLKKRRNYILRNRSSAINHGAQHSAGQRIATSTAQASVNALVAKRFVKKQ